LICLKRTCALSFWLSLPLLLKNFARTFGCIVVNCFRNIPYILPLLYVRLLASVMFLLLLLPYGILVSRIFFQLFLLHLWARGNRGSALRLNLIPTGWPVRVSINILF